MGALKQSSMDQRQDALNGLPSERELVSSPGEYYSPDAANPVDQAETAREQEWIDAMRNLNRFFNTYQTMAQYRNQLTSSGTETHTVDSQASTYDDDAATITGPATVNGLTPDQLNPTLAQDEVDNEYTSGGTYGAFGTSRIVPSSIRDFGTNVTRMPKLSTKKGPDLTNSLLQAAITRLSTPATPATSSTNPSVKKTSAKVPGLKEAAKVASLRTAPKLGSGLKTKKYGS